MMWAMEAFLASMDKIESDSDMLGISGNIKNSAIFCNDLSTTDLVQNN